MITPHTLGLYIPEFVPQLSPSDLANLADKSFTAMASVIFSLFIPQSAIPTSDLNSLVDKSFSTFNSPYVTPLSQLSVPLDTSNIEFHLLELFHGPTLAFKDVALQFLGNVFEYFLERKNRNKNEQQQETHKLTILGATSGDTGRLG
jgi:threonine synthase